MLRKRLIREIMMIACLMLAIIGFGSFNQARAASVCGGIGFNPGWLHFDVTTKSAWTDGLLGTIETYKGSNRAGIDWLYNGDTFLETMYSGSSSSHGGARQMGGTPRYRLQILTMIL